MLDIVRTQFNGAVSSFPMTVVPATLLTSLQTYTGGHLEAFITWCILSAGDLVFGVILAIVQHKFCARKLYHWAGRVLVQLLSVFIFAAVLRMFTLAAGVELFFANWLLFFFALMDATSILNKLLVLGFMPKPAYVILKMLRRRSSRVFATLMDDPDMARELERSLRSTKPATAQDAKCPPVDADKETS